MAYKLKKNTDFLKYLTSYLNEHPFKHNVVPDFKDLSELYSFLLNNKNMYFSRDFNDNLCNVLKNNFNISHDQLITFDENFNKYIITDNNLYCLASIIKDKYLDYISSKVSNVDEEELYKLALIVNKTFPGTFLDLIEKHVSEADFQKQLDFIRQKFKDTTDIWLKHIDPSSKEETRDIGGSIYFIFKELFPELDIYEPGRRKSPKSSISNFKKELKKEILNLIPSDVSKGLTYEDVEKNFSLKGTLTDFTALTVVLSNTDDTLHFDKNDAFAKEIFELRKTRSNNLNFIHSLENFLTNNDDYTFSELLQMQIELLIRLRNSTYEECTKEYENTSFSKILENTINQYMENQDEKSVDDNLIEQNINTTYKLLDELKDRVHDKYQFKLLESSVPEVLNAKIFEDTLNVKSCFVKKVIKPNGFVALYYYIITKDGKIIELQVQSKKRYKDSKDGPSEHNRLEDKEIDIDMFFEPSNSEITPEIFKENLKLLNNTPIAHKNFLYNAQDSELSPREVRLKRKLKAAFRTVKLKEEVGPNSESINIYLPRFAKFHSPELFAFGSPHTRFNSSIAGYSEKNLVTNFTEVLLKHDCTTCLSQMLIDKLNEITPYDKNSISKNGVIERAAKRFDRTEGPSLE